MNKKGQALVEFILILPILIFMILAIIDISRIMIMKNHLESILNDVNKDTEIINDKEYDINIEKKDNFITLKSCTKVITPGLNKILGSKTCVSTSKEIKE